MIKFSILLLLYVFSSICLAGDNTLTPEKEMALRELAKRVGIEYKKNLKESEKLKGRLLYLRGNNLSLGNSCDLSKDIWARIYKNKSEFQEVILLLQYCILY